MVVKIRVQSNNPNRPHQVEIADTIESFKNVSLLQLKEKLYKIESLRPALNETALTFNGIVMDNGEKTMSQYGLTEYSLVEFQKYYNKDKHFGIKFVRMADAITGDDNTDVLRAELSCGHAVDPNSLTAWCRSLMDSGKFEFYCPAIVDDDTEKCNKKWPYIEIRKIALLNEAETSNFEKKLSENAANSFIDYKECPRYKFKCIFLNHL